MESTRRSSTPKIFWRSSTGHRDTLQEIIEKNIYNLMFLPPLDYCCVVWQECGKCVQQRVEQIQNSAMGLICAKPPRNPIDVLRRKLTWITLTKHRETF